MQQIWEGEKNRQLRLQRPCECGCDVRDGEKGVGYLTGSDKDGNGFTVWIESEEVFSAIERVMEAEEQVICDACGDAILPDQRNVGHECDLHEGCAGE